MRVASSSSSEPPFVGAATEPRGPFHRRAAFSTVAKTLRASAIKEEEGVNHKYNNDNGFTTQWNKYTALSRLCGVSRDDDGEARSPVCREARRGGSMLQKEVTDYEIRKNLQTQFLLLKTLR
jgi:hypothetical protein